MTTEHTVSTEDPAEILHVERQYTVQRKLLLITEANILDDSAVNILLSHADLLQRSDYFTAGAIGASPEMLEISVFRSQ